MDLAGNEPFIQTNSVNNKLTQPKASQQNKITNMKQFDYYLIGIHNRIMFSLLKLIKTSSIHNFVHLLY